jgi:asparagine synthase (glutamine-hydrolysing)
LLEGYAKLPAGHFLRFDLKTNALSVAPYWTLPQRDPNAAERSFDDLADELEQLLDQAVKRQLVADVPVGILLSGGLDSSLIAATAAHVSGKVTTFTIGFPGHAAFDESPLARRLAADLNTEHIELMVEADSPDLLARFAEQFDEPIADSSMIPTFMVSRLVRTRATVALGGDGGDELFGGYHHHGWMQNMARLRRVGVHHLPLVRALADKLIPYGSMTRKTVLRLLDRHDPAITVTRLMEPGLRQALIGGHRGVPSQAAEDFRAALVARWHEPRERAMALDYLTYMCDDILVKVDRSSMLTSLEVRAPLLDPAIIEFAFGQLSPDQRVSPTGRKLMLRKLASRRLPAWFDTSRKQGFSIPLAAWLRGPWRPLLEDIAASSGDGLLNADAVRGFLRGGLSADRLAHPVYQVAMLELWRRQYRITMD